MIKAGDYVIKDSGRQKGLTGLVIRVIENSLNNSIVEVLVSGEIHLWPRQLVLKLEERT